MSKSDSRSWGNYGEFAATHGSRCSNPVTLRATIGWFPVFLHLDDIKNGPLKWVIGIIYQGFPALFGAKVLFCPNCSSVAFGSKLSSRLFDFIRDYIHRPEDETMLFYEPDVARQMDADAQKEMNLVNT